ncbi:MAG: hypothetical protein AAF125_07090, partial [Chloroflexota bacterium]
MRRRRLTLILIAILLFGVGAWGLAQDTPAEGVTVVQQITKPRPTGSLYNRPLDQILWIEAGSGALQLVDARTYSVQHTLYETGLYNTYTFSADGRLLAVGLERRVDLWDATTGELLETFEPQGVLDIAAPLQFAEDNGLLLVNSVVRAPQAIRRSENDTSILPWLWDIPSALREADSTLPGGVDAYAFFDYRNGFTLGFNDMVLSARPGRIEVLDASGPQTNVILSEIQSNRFERDPLNVWQGQINRYMYVRANDNAQTLTHVSSSGAISTFNPDGEFVGGRGVSAQERTVFQQLLLNGVAYPIGGENTQTANSLTRRLLGDGYTADFGYAPRTIRLVDMLTPVTSTARTQAPIQVLLYIYSDEVSSGRFQISTLPGVRLARLSPDATQIALYTAQGNIEIYELSSGALLRSITPALPVADGNVVFDFSPDGTQLVYDFQRFDIATGEVVLQDLAYNYRFDRVVFSENNRHLNTYDIQVNEATGDAVLDWWQWDVDTGRLLRREGADLLTPPTAVSDDGERFLSLSTDTGQLEIERLNIATQTRESIFVDNLFGRQISEVLPSPNWTRVMVVYTPSVNSQHNPGNEVAVYNFDDGLALFLAGADLPPLAGRRYRWLSENQVGIAALDVRSSVQPRVYDVDYAASGLPECLTTA